MNSKNEYCLIGIDEFNVEIANFLQDAGCKVVLLDINQQKVDQLATKFPYVFKVDSTNISALESLNVDQFDYVIVGINDMEGSILTVANLKKINATNIIAKANNDVHKQVLIALAGSKPIKVVYPDEAVAGLLAYRILNGLDLDLTVGNHDITLINVPVKNSKLFGNPISEFELKSQFLVNIIFIKRESQIIFPVRSSTELMKDDVVTLACINDSVDEVLKLFTGNK